MPKAVYLEPDVNKNEIMGQTVERHEAEERGLLAAARRRERGEPAPAASPDIQPAGTVMPTPTAPSAVNTAMVQQIIANGGVYCACGGAHFLEEDDRKRVALAYLREHPELTAPKVKATAMTPEAKERAQEIRKETDEELAETEPFVRDPADFSAQEKLGVIERWEANTDPLERSMLATEEGINKQQIAAWRRAKKRIQRKAEDEITRELEADAAVEV